LQAWFQEVKMDPVSGTSMFSSWFSGLPPVAFFLMVLCAFGLGFLMRRLANANHLARANALEQDLKNSEKRIASLKQGKNDLVSVMETLKRQNREFGAFISMIPDSVERLNTCEKLDDILLNLVHITEKLLQTREVSVFVREKDLLVMKAASDLPPVSSPPMSIRMGEGKIGWVAQKGISMTDRDLQQESTLVKISLLKTDSDLATKICSPIVYNGTLLGVLNIGNLPGEMDQGLRVARMITSLGSIAMGNILLKEEVRSGSEKDGLTGLYSLQYFLNELRKELSKARRYKRPVSVCHFNMDSFQKYNEINGYLAGDEALRMVGKILKDHIREQDIAARYGGKEFVLFCPETRREDAVFLSDKLREIICNASFPQKDRMSGGKLTVSGGVAGYPEDGADEAELIASAVQATQKSINGGRNRISQAGAGKESGKFTIQQ